MYCRTNVSLKCASSSCERQATRFCKKSSAYFCKNCVEKCGHLETSFLFHPVKPSRWGNNMFPYCKGHDAFETFFCLKCAKLCCKYCEREFHSDHGTMLLEDYNKAKYEETITKELQKLNNSMTKWEELRKDIESRIANCKIMETDFFKSLAERKRLLVAKCIDMICDIEKEYRINYCKMKSKYDDELSKMLIAYDHAMAKCNIIFDQEKKYSKRNSLEKLYNLNQLAVNIKQCNKCFNTANPKLEYSLNSHDKDDESLFLCLNESFGVSLTLSGPYNEDCGYLKNNFTYHPSFVIKNNLKRDKEICTFIKTKLDRMLNLQ